MEAEAFGMKGVNVDSVAATMRVFLERRGQPLIYDDPANGQKLRIGAGASSASDGLLPAILVAGESVWRDLTSKGFELDLARDPAALLGYRLRGIGGGNFSIVMLASIEALHQVLGQDGFVVNEFNALWATAAHRGRDHWETDPAVRSGPSP
jgi:hypothetical protein